jgi:hypothetical protein
MLTSKRAVILATIAGVAAVCITAMLHAEPEPNAAPSVPGKTDLAPEAVLGGPRIVQRPERPTIVSRDSDGKLVRLEDRPEIAAVATLKLEGEAKKAADKVLNEHGALVAKALNENQALFLQIQSARKSNDQRAAMPLIREMHQKAPELWEPRLVDQLAKAIPVEKAVVLRNVVNEYLTELAKEGGPDGAGKPRRETKPETPGANGSGGNGGGMIMNDGEGGGMMNGGGDKGAAPMPEPSLLDDPQTVRRLENALVIREMARSLKTLTEMRKEQTERMLAGLGLTPEQDAKIRNLIRDTGRNSKDGQPSREQHRALIEEIRKQLTPEQSKQLTENLKNR